jgi:hypothetical protein
MLSAPTRVGSTRCTERRTVTDVAWFTLAQPTAGAASAEPAGVAELAGAAA